MSEKVMKGILKKTNEKKYPESVLNITDMLKEARKTSEDKEKEIRALKDIFEKVNTNKKPKMKEIKQKTVEEDEETKEKNNPPPSSSSSEYDSPQGSSPTKHICGSLFAGCVEQRPLVQTFTDPNSQLSLSTFTKKNNSNKCVNFNKINNPDLENNKVIFKSKSFDYSKSNKLLIRRHNSLPSHKTHEDSPVSLDEILVEKKADRKLRKEKRSGTPIFENSTNGNILENFKHPGIADGYGGDINGNKKYLILDSESSDDGGNLDEDIDEELDQVNEYVNGDLLSMGTGVSLCQSSDNQVHDATTNGNITKGYIGSNYHHAIQHDYEYLRCSIPRLKQEARDWESKADILETEVLSLRRELKKKDQENVRLQREIHKLRSVLQQATSFKQDGDLLSSLQDSHGMPGQQQQVIAAPTSNKKQGVSGESTDHSTKYDQIEIERYDKDFRSKQLIKEAIMDNDFLKNLDSSQVRELVESVFPKEFPDGSYVIKEGDAGSHLYVSAEGEFEVIKEDKVLGRMGPGKAFGELAILYNCTRTASIRVVTDAKVWVLDRRVFQQIMMRTGLQRLQDNVNFLRSVSLLHNLSDDLLAKIADVLEVEFYPAGAHIIRQGASGDTFFIISEGRVKVTQRLPGRRDDEEIRTLNKGDYFGEQALLKEDCRTANIIALSPGVECLTLDRDSFIQLIGDLSELHEKDYGDESRGLSRPSSAFSLLHEEEYDYIRLDDLDVVATLGVGGFGRVELVQYVYDKSLTFALKCLKKQHIVDTQQQEHAYSEKNIMMSCNSTFICRLYKTFRDSKYVYMLLEACLGGEVWTILRDRGCFDDHTTKFITGCVVEAFEYLHARGIIYRDLKPENLLLDMQGYAKLVDFGFSKRIGFSSKTWTFCGTPEYVAPEVILNKGHDRAVDYWALGVLMHELLTGTPPFTASDPMKTYNIILKGIDMIHFPKHITRTSQSLIKRLCRDSPSERLGYQRGGLQDIKKHKWFQGFDWDGLKNKTLAAPIQPQVRNPTDTANFDSFPKDIDIPLDEFSNWDADF